MYICITNLIGLHQTASHNKLTVNWLNEFINDDLLVLKFGLFGMYISIKLKSLLNYIIHLRAFQIRERQTEALLLHCLKLK